jgi:septum formation protein
MALNKRLILAHTLISILSCTTSSSAARPPTVAFALQQRRRSFPARRNLDWGRLLEPTTHESSTWLHAISRNRHFWTLTHSKTRMSSQTTEAAESTEGTITQHSPDRPQLVLSVQNHLRHNTDGTNNSDETTTEIQLVLASASPRRREILDMMGLQSRYVVIPSPLNESHIQNKLRKNNHVDPILYTRILAEQKAYAVAYDLLSQQQSISSELSNKDSTNDSLHPTATRLILGSDTVVAITDDSTNITTLLEKPIDTKDAIRMLQQLQNRSHIVYTGLAIVQYTPLPPPTSSLPQIQETITDGDGYYQDNLRYSIQLVHSFVEMATVYISAMNELDIESYVATQEPMDKAGAYGIQGIGGQMVTRIDGDFFTVCMCYCSARNVVVWLSFFSRLH